MREEKGRKRKKKRREINRERERERELWAMSHRRSSLNSEKSIRSRPPLYVENHMHIQHVRE